MPHTVKNRRVVPLENGDYRIEEVDTGMSESEHRRMMSLMGSCIFRTLSGMTDSSIDRPHGYVLTTYNNLVAALGPPKFERLRGAGFRRFTCLFFLENDVRIYDYNQMWTPRGLFAWSVGGKDVGALEVVRTKLENVTIDHETSKKTLKLKRKLAEVMAELDELVEDGSSINEDGYVRLSKRLKAVHEAI
jgi:hypothetical protein